MISFWKTAFASFIWATTGLIVALFSLDFIEWGLVQHSIKHFPTQIPTVLAKTADESSEIFYGGHFVHLGIRLIRKLRKTNVVTHQPILPILRPPPLYPLLSSYDFIVAGGGTAGSVVAGRLAETNASVILLEAGSPVIDGWLSTELLPIASLLNQNGEYDWQYRTQPQNDACLGQNNRSSFWPRGKILGGSSVLNFMIYHKGHPHDYDLWSTCLNDSSWNSESVGKVFEDLETIHFSHAIENISKVPFPRGSSGPIPLSLKQPLSSFSDAFLVAARKLGFGDSTDYNSGTNTTGGSAIEFNKSPDSGQRRSFYRMFVHEKIDSLMMKTKTAGTIHVVPYAHVTKILLDWSSANGKPKAIGVEFVIIPPSLSTLTSNELQKLPRQTVRASKEVILSLGAIGTPQVLMNSGIGPKDHLEKIFIDAQIVDVPAVGQNLVDHIMHPLMFSVKQKRHLLSQVLSIPNALRPIVIWNYFRHGHGIMSTPGCDTQIMIPQIESLPRSIPDFCYDISDENKIKQLLETPDLQILLYGGAPDVWELQEKLNIPLDIPLRYGLAQHWNLRFHELELFRSLQGSLNDRLARLESLGTKLNILLVLPVLLRPESKGFLRLNSSNPFDHPIIHPLYLTSPRDIEVLLKGVRIAEKLMRIEEWREVVASMMYPNCATREKIKDKDAIEWDYADLPSDQKTLCEQTEYGSDEFWMTLIRRLTLTLYHPAGTCRMGKVSDPMACVNSNLQMIKVEKLRIADASVMPTLTSGNTQAPVAMVGDMLSRFLKKEYQLA